jgi:hypothetical protein
MFYPKSAFPHTVPGLSAAETLDAEFSVMCGLIEGDRDYHRGLSREELVRSWLDELRFLAVAVPANESEIESLLRRNAASLEAFVRNQLPEAREPSDAAWLVPDWNLVRQHLGETALALWRQRIATQQRADVLEPTTVAG